MYKDNPMQYVYIFFLGSVSDRRTFVLPHSKFGTLVGREFLLSFFRSGMRKHTTYFIHSVTKVPWQLNSLLVAFVFLLH